MKKLIRGLSTAVFIIVFTFPLGLGLAAEADESIKVDNSTAKSSSAYEKVALSLTGSENIDLIEGSTFHRFIQLGKDSLGVFGQQLAAVYANYPNVFPEINRSIRDLTDGKGFGGLAKITLLFLLLIAAAFGIESIVRIPLKKVKQRLQTGVPKCIVTLAARLSGRVLLELISLAVFALAVVGLYLLF